MNFLAHLYLSGNNTKVMIGNLIADHIKGNKFNYLPKEVQKGVVIHRKIDHYTDTHNVVKKSKRRLHKRYGHYDGIIVDIFYDYFLAKNWQKYSQIPLDIYTKSVYKLLMQNIKILPEQTKKILPYMIRQNWLYNYQFLNGIEAVLYEMNIRTQGKSKMNLAINDLRSFETDFQSDFFFFFKDLQVFCYNELSKTLIN